MSIHKTTFLTKKKKKKGREESMALSITQPVMTSK